MSFALTASRASAAAFAAAVESASFAFTASSLVCASMTAVLAASRSAWLAWLRAFCKSLTFLSAACFWIFQLFNTVLAAWSLL